MDLKTLEFANASMLWVDVLVIWLFGRAHSNLKGSGWLALGTACLALGAVVVADPRLLPAVASSLLANFLAVSGFLVINRGIAAYLGRSNDTLAGELLLLAAAMMVSFHFTVTRPEVWTRSALISFALAAELLVAAALLRAPVRPARLGERMVATWPGAVAVFAFAAFNVVRGISTLLAGHHASEEQRVQVVVAVGVMAFSAALTLGYVWMMTAEIHGELERLARIDSLTGVFNRGAFETLGAKAVATARAAALPLSLAVFDLDHFKQLNDEFGHAAGDTVLSNVAQALQSYVGPRGTTVRMGGEEFAAILVGQNEADALHWAEQMRRQVETMNLRFENTAITVTASVGVAQLRSGDGSATALWLRADYALYAAKQAGRNRVCAAEAAPGRTRTEANLLTALD